MSQIIELADADQQIAEAVAAEYESLSLACRADAPRLERLLAPDFHEFGASGGEIGYAGTAELVARSTDPDGENHGRRSNRTSLWRRAEAGNWRIFHHQGTITNR